MNRKIYWVQGITIIWMIAECTVALYSAIVTHSVSILAFGSDSVIELLSAFVALLAFLPKLAISEERTAKWSGILLALLGLMIVCEAILSLVRRGEAVESWSGIIITALALVVMPILAWWKRNLARQTGNRALAADAVQSASCAYIAGITLCGLGLSGIVHIRWADPVAALVAVPLILYEARRALRGEPCACGPSKDLCLPPRSASH